MTRARVDLHHNQVTIFCKSYSCIILSVLNINIRFYKIQIDCNLSLKLLKNILGHKDFNLAIIKVTINVLTIILLKIISKYN